MPCFSGRTNDERLCKTSDAVVLFLKFRYGYMYRSVPVVFFYLFKSMIEDHAGDTTFQMDKTHNRAKATEKWVTYIWNIFKLLNMKHTRPGYMQDR